MKTDQLKTRIQSLKSVVSRAATALVLAATVLTAKTSLAALPNTSLDTQLRSRINHIIVIYQENWSFDSLYGQFPGVNGLANGFDNLPQVDKTAGYTNYIYQTPQPLNGGSDLRFPPGNGQLALPLIPYDLMKYVAATNTTR
jgi:phospholipase C